MAIQYFLTDVGRDVALNATSLGLNVSLSHIAVGTAKYDPLTALDNTALVAEVERYPLNGGSVEPNTHTLRFVSNIEPSVTVDGFEIGLYTDTGVLFAIASTAGNDPLIRLVANIVSIVTFGMILSTIDLTNLSISIDPNTPICVALMNEHLAHPDPHPQYALKTEILPHLKSLADLIWRVNSWHGNDDVDYDPSIELEPIFGYRTVWRLRPYIPYGVENLTDALLQEIDISTLESQVKTSTTRIWKRMKDEYHDPVYTLTSNQEIGIDVGESVTFTLQTEHVAAGTAVGWKLETSGGHPGLNQNINLTPSNLSGIFIVDENGAASHTVKLDNIRTNGLYSELRKLKMSLLDADVSIEIGLFKPHFMALIKRYVDSIENPTTAYNNKRLGLLLQYVDQAKHVGKTFEIELSGNALGYTDPETGFYGGYLLMGHEPYVFGTEYWVSTHNPFNGSFEQTETPYSQLEFAQFCVSEREPVPKDLVLIAKTIVDGNVIYTHNLTVNTTEDII